MITLSLIAVIALLIIALGIICHRVADRRHRQRHLVGLEIACDLLNLMKNIQQHRGVSSAILGGNDSQSRKLQGLSANIDRGFIDVANKMPEAYQTEFVQIKAKWELLKTSWAEIDVLANFESHCELVRKIQSLMHDLTDFCGLTSSGDDQERQLAGTIFSQLPCVIENLGQLRALSTHAATRHNCITAFKLHLRYISNQLNHQHSSLQSKSLGSHNRGQQIKDLLVLIQAEILSTEVISIDPDTLFKTVTQVMENCYSDIDLGIKQLGSLSA